MDKRLDSLEEDLKEFHTEFNNLKKTKDSIEDIKDVLMKLAAKKKRRNRSNSKGIERDNKLLLFLTKPHNTNEVCNKFDYSRSYASFILNGLKKKGVIKIAKKMGNIPYFIIK